MTTALLILVSLVLVLQVFVIVTLCWLLEQRCSESLVVVKDDFVGPLPAGYRPIWNQAAMADPDPTLDPTMKSRCTPADPPMFVPAAWRATWSQPSLTSGRIGISFNALDGDRVLRLLLDKESATRVIRTLQHAIRRGEGQEGPPPSRRRTGGPAAVFTDHTRAVVRCGVCCEEISMPEGHLDFVLDVLSSFRKQHADCDPSLARLRYRQSEAKDRHPELCRFVEPQKPEVAT